MYAVAVGPKEYVASEYACSVLQVAEVPLRAEIVAVDLYPELGFIHIHQLFRILYTCFELDAVNIGWWICIIVCLVLVDFLDSHP